MKKILFALGITFAISIIGAGIVYSAPVYRLERSILPETTNTYYLGSTSPNLQWKGGYFNDLTVTGTCTGCGSGSVSGGTAGMIASWINSNTLTATGTPTAAAYTATSTTATSTFPIIRIGSRLDAGQIALNRANGITSIFRSSTDTNASRGSAFDSALAASVSGDHIQIGPGTYARTTGSFVVPAGVTMAGAGKDSTIITKTAGDGGIVEGVINIQGSTTISNLQVLSAVPIVAATQADIAVEHSGTGVSHFKNVRLTADVDVINDSFGGTTYIENSELRCKYDCVNGSSATIEIRDSSIISRGPSAFGDGITRAVGSAEGMTVHVYNSTLEAYGGTSRTATVFTSDGGVIDLNDSTIIATSSAGNIYGVQLEDGTATIHGGSIRVSGSGALDIINTASTINVYGGSGSGSAGLYVTSGTVTYSDAGTSIVPSTGNIGISTTSPYAKLSVVGEVVGRNFTATSTTNTSTFNGFVSSPKWTTGQFMYSNAGVLTSTNAITLSGPVVTIAGNLSLPSGADFALSTLTNVGNIQLNTAGGFLYSDGPLQNILSSTSPTVGHITATSTTATSTFNGVLSVGSTTPHETSMFSVGSTTPRLVVNKSSGAVGIGTASPDANNRLTVSRASTLPNAYGILIQNTSTGGSGFQIRNSNVASNNSWQFFVTSDATPKFVIGQDNIANYITVLTSTGFTGFGQGTPLEVIDVNGNISIGDTSRHINLGSNGTIQLHPTSGNNASYLLDRPSSSEAASADFVTGGNTGVGWSLQIAGSDTGFTFLDRNLNNPTLYLQEGTGQVGINNTNPQYSLDVTGTLGAILTTSTGNAVCYTGGQLTDSGSTDCITSSARFKDNIQDLNIGLQELLQFRPRMYDRKVPLPSQKSGKEIGFLAEEIAQIDPRFVTYEKDGVTIRGLNNSMFAPLIIKGMQEQQDKIDVLEAQVHQLMAELEALKNSK